LALLQAEELACVLELANVPNVRWLFTLFASRQNKNLSIEHLGSFSQALHLTLVNVYYIYISFIDLKTYTYTAHTVV
jgi:hypothetical protein